MTEQTKKILDKGIKLLKANDGRFPNHRHTVGFIPGYEKDITHEEIAIILELHSSLPEIIKLITELQNERINGETISDK